MCTVREICSRISEDNQEPEEEIFFSRYDWLPDALADYEAETYQVSPDLLADYERSQYYVA